jgi:CcmD family protein
VRRAALVLAGWLAPVIALAQETGDRATSFQAVSGSAHEDVPGGTLLVAAYAIVLALVVAYVVYVARMQASAAEELTRLEKMLEDKTKKD